MPIPRNLRKALSYTSSGVPYQTLLDGYDEQWAANANQISICVLIGWEDRDEFLQDAVGYSTWNGSSTTLQRVLPIQTPDGSGLWCDEAKFLKKGVISPSTGEGILFDGATNLADASMGNWPTWDFAMYRLTFLRPPWWVRSDSVLSTSYGNLEQNRYVKMNRRYNPRLRKKPGYVFEYNLGAAAPGPTVANWSPADEVGFLPDLQIEYIVTWMQVPYLAVPWNEIGAAGNTVNLTTFTLSGQTFEPGTLLFRGPADPIAWYQGADGNFYYDLQLTFGFQLGGWNYYQLNALDASTTPPQRQWVPIRARGYDAPTSLTVTNPPFPSTEFQDLFTPAAS